MHFSASAKTIYWGTVGHIIYCATANRNRSLQQIRFVSTIFIMMWCCSTIELGPCGVFMFLAGLMARMNTAHIHSEYWEKVCNRTQQF
jgi:hypothetical protein